MVHFSPLGKTGVARSLSVEMDNSSDKGDREGEGGEQIGTATQRAEATPHPEEGENGGTEEDKEVQLKSKKQKEASKPKKGDEAGTQKTSELGTGTTKETEMNATAGDGHNQ